MNDEPLYVPDEFPEDTPDENLVPVFSVAAPLYGVEGMIAHGAQEKSEHPEKGLFVNLDPVELSIVQGGLYLMTLLYGRHLVGPVVKKFLELIDSQEFCDCENCQRERDEKEEDDGPESPEDH